MSMLPSPVMIAVLFVSLSSYIYQRATLVFFVFANPDMSAAFISQYLQLSHMVYVCAKSKVNQ